MRTHRIEAVERPNPGSVSVTNDHDCAVNIHYLNTGLELKQNMIKKINKLHM